MEYMELSCASCFYENNTSLTEIDSGHI